jgi:capsular exopolysaccharide synthesis family protein
MTLLRAVDHVDGAGTSRRGRSLAATADLPPAPDGGNPGRIDEHLVSLLVPESFEAEQYRALRHVVEQRSRRRALTAIAVTSAAAGEGKTTTAINLAGALSQDPGARVLLVDADLRLSSVREQLGLAATAPGLVEAVLDPGIALEDLVQRPTAFNLSILPGGRPPEAPYEILKSPRLGDLLEEARRRYDTVVIDTPPLVPVPDCRILAKWVDGFLLVVAAHRTPRLLVDEALALMDPDQVIGIVFNGDDRLFSAYSGYHYGYDRTRSAGRAGWWERAAGRRRAGATWR